MKKVNEQSVETRFLTPAQTGDRWHMHEESIRRMLRQRRLASVVISRRRLIPLDEILRVESAGRIACPA